MGLLDVVLPCLAASLLAYLLVLAIYRLLLHPLSHLPGPKLAALTSWYEAYYDAYLPGQYVFKIVELHKQYGPVLRITPNEVSVSDPDFLDTVYAPGHGQKRDKDGEKAKGLGLALSVGGAVAHELHKRRREALNPFFSKMSVARLAPELGERIVQLEGIWERAKGTEEVVNLSDCYFALANDIVGEYCFGHAQETLQPNPTLAGTRRTNINQVLRGVKFNLQFPWVRDLMQKLPLSVAAKFTPPGIRDMIRFRHGIRKEIGNILYDHIAPSPEKVRKSVFEELRDSKLLPHAEKSAERLEDEAVLLVMAGTMSTMLSLAMAHYQLLANPEVMRKLREELREAGLSESRDLVKLERLEYLNGIIQEAHRLTFGLTGRNPRVDPERDMEYVDTSMLGVSRPTRAYRIPAGTPVSIQTLMVHGNGEIFPDPWKFMPERWMGEEGKERRKYQMVFSRGPRMCIGMHLANAEMVVSVAAMSRWDMELWETGEGDVVFRHDYHVATPRLDSRGVRVMVRGRAV